MWHVPPGGCLVLWASPTEGAHLQAVLDDDERARHDALRRAGDRARYATAHALLRAALGALLDVPPAALRFTRRCAHCGGPHGPPRLDPSGPQLSLSHSGDRVAVAIADRPIGVDVEQLVALCDLAGLARQVLTAPERTAVLDAAALLAVWTRKEAALKATGYGLAAPLLDLVVTAPDAPAGVVSWTGSTAPREPVHLVDLRPGPGHVGCVAMLGARVPVVEEHAADGLLAAV